MADNIVPNSDLFYTQNMKPEPNEGVNALWARMIASNTGAAYYFRTTFLSKESFTAYEERDFDTGYNWASRWVLIFAVQDSTLGDIENKWTAKVGSEVLVGATTKTERIVIQVLQLTSAFQAVEMDRTSPETDLQIKYTSGGGFTIKNNQGVSAYVTMIVIALKKVS